MNVAEAHRQEVQRLFDLGVDDAGGAFPDYLLKQASGEVEVPVWNPLAPKGMGWGFI